jgi:hypothetical protein
MKIQKRNKKNIWVVLIILLVIQILFDPLSPILHVSQSAKAKLLLPLARQKWESQGVTHYSYDVYAFSQMCFMGANIEVDDGVVVHAGPVKNPDPWDMIQGVRQQNPGFPPDTWFLCNYKNYTVPNWFDHLEKKVQITRSTGTSISFDNKYGFISRFRLDWSSGNGLLEPKIRSCCYGFRIWNFQVLDE